MEGSKDYSMPLAPMKLDDKVETIRLVPFGCTHLRLSYLPWTDH